jgi:hypothetical protein
VTYIYYTYSSLQLLWRTSIIQFSAVPVTYSHAHLNVLILLFFIFLTVTKVCLEPFSSPTDTTSACDSVVKQPTFLTYITHSYTVGVYMNKRFKRKRKRFNLLKTKRNLLYIRISPYRAVNTFHHGYKTQSVNDVQSKSRCLFWVPYKTLNAKRAPCRIFEC